MHTRDTPAWRRYLRFWGANVPQDVNDELAFHLEMRTREYVARGMSEIEARQLAEQRFGNAEAARRQCVSIDEQFAGRKERRRILTMLAQDVAFATRIIRRQLLPALSAVLCVALGIGATTTMFSVANSLLLRPLPYPNGDRLVTVGVFRASDRPGTVSLLDYLDWRARQHTFAGLGAIGQWDFVVLRDHAEIVPGALISANFFRVLGATPSLGRLFSDEEERPDGKPVMLVSHSFAERELGGDRGALGQTLRISGERREIVGIIPDQWRFPSRGDVWVPKQRNPMREDRGNRNLQIVGLLPAGGSPDAPRRDIAAIAASLAREYPETDGGLTTSVTPLRELYVGDARAGLYAMVLAALIVLAVACTNVAALQLARATARSREMAVRSAIGASRRRVVLQLLTESVLLALAGGLGGCGVALWGRDIAAQAVIGRSVPAWMSFELDLRALAFAVVISTLTGIVFGIAPALRLAHQDQAHVLRGGSVNVGRGRLQRTFVVTELALSIVLIVGASLAIESVRRVQAIPLGIDPTGVLTFRVSFQGPRYDDPRVRAQLIAALRRQLRALPGVTASGAVSLPPIEGCCSQFSTFVEGFPTDRAHAPMITGTVATPGYLQTMGIHLVAGRDFMEGDERSTPLVTIVNETFARAYWSAGNALGHHVDTGLGPATIVGVVSDVKQNGLLQAPEPQFYRPYAQDPWTAVTVTVRVRSGDPLLVMPEVRRIMRALDPGVPIFRVTTMREMIDQHIVSSRVFSELLTVFACIALILAATGVYATMAFAVSQRTRELGLRVALGAEPARVTALVLRQSLVMAVVGGVIGLIAGAFAARALGHTLYGVDPSEPWGYASAIIVLSVAAIAAGYGPARRASAVDPMVALRAE